MGISEYNRRLKKGYWNDRTGQHGVSQEFMDMGLGGNWNGGQVFG